jgi:hypothetical protein
MYREAVYSTLRISGYEQIRRMIAANDPTNTNPMIKFTAALVSGGIGSAVLSSRAPFFSSKRCLVGEPF